jgi:hypothetical protein
MPDLLRTIFHLQNDPDAQARKAPEKPIEPRLALMRVWQSQRLSRTYTDLLADAQYAAACRFFLSDIYADRDFSQRDQDADRLHGLLSRYLPAHMLRLLGDVIHLTQMTDRLDNKLAHVLAEDLGVTDVITEDAYAQAYRICDNYSERKEQIERLAGILEEICRGAKLPLVGVTLRMGRLPAHKLGWIELYDFLERGYAASQPMKDVQRFVQTIYRREMSILERIFQNDPSPFEIPN